jgi:hypothetical protein
MEDLGMNRDSCKEEEQVWGKDSRQFNISTPVSTLANGSRLAGRNIERHGRTAQIDFPGSLLGYAVVLEPMTTMCAASLQNPISRRLPGSTQAARLRGGDAGRHAAHRRLQPKGADPRTPAGKKLASCLGRRCCWSSRSRCQRLKADLISIVASLVHRSAAIVREPHRTRSPRQQPRRIDRPALLWGRAGGMDGARSIVLFLPFLFLSFRMQQRTTLAAVC